jgi:hypothetical protein
VIAPAVQHVPPRTEPMGVDPDDSGSWSTTPIATGRSVIRQITPPRLTLLFHRREPGAWS